MNSQLYDYTMARFEALIRSHIEKEMVGKVFTIVTQGETYRLTIDHFYVKDIDLAAELEHKPVYWVHDRESLSD